jgi:hypothetical protein
MSSLYSETKELMAFRQMAEHDDLPAEVINDTIEGMSEGFDMKAVAMYQVTEEMDADVLVLDDMIAKLQDRKKRIVAKQKNMRGFLLEAMTNTGITKISCPYFTISLAKTAAPTIIDSEDEIPDDLMVVKTSIVPDKKAITARLRDGEDVPGCRLGEQGQSIRIKR